MTSLHALMKKELLEAVRTGKIVILFLLFVLFGIMNPAIAKLTPFIMDIMADSIAESGFIITNVHVDALTSWAQFFKNIPMVLIAFVLIFSDVFTKEYKSGTLILLLTKGLSRDKVVLAKSIWLLSSWTIGCAISVAITYGYNAIFWDNGIANDIFFAVSAWWLFGIWVIGLLVIFSILMQSNTGVSLCICAVVLLAYLFTIIPSVKDYSPIVLVNAHLLLTGAGGREAYIKAMVVALSLCTACIAASMPLLNKKQF